MKFKNIFRYAVVAVAAGSMLGVTSCNYLDVVPPEQPELEDAMKTHKDALGFLYSCYGGLSAESMIPAAHQMVVNASTDEWVLPNEQESAYSTVFAAMKNTQSSALGSTLHNSYWGHLYAYIGQCLLFEQQYDEIGRENGVCDSEQEEREWLAEVRFLKAFYHFALLRVYGPIPLTQELIDMDAPESDFPGRSHMDYCVRYLANEFYEAAKDLPETRENTYLGRATKVIAMAMRAKVLLYGASDLYNGKFPFPDWKNPDFETPGYGTELISRTYDRQKWVNAYNATLEAINLAETYGHSLMQEYETENDVDIHSMDWIPVDFENDAEKEQFLTKIMLNRYIHTTSASENPEILWSIKYEVPYLYSARLPLRIIQKPSTKEWYSLGYSVVNPTLNTVYNFLCKDGRLPAESHPGMDFSPKSDWFKAISGAAAGHEDMINLVRNREPRFYAWIAFDGGNFLSNLRDGEPLTLNFKSNEMQGYQPALQPKNYASTGFLSMKHLNPRSRVTKELSLQSGTAHPVVLCRLTELYLNLAECAAELANPKHPGAQASYADIALERVNTVRRRAGVPDLTESQINSTVSNPVNNTAKQMTLVEWVRQERFIELWDEGQRFFDVRRWAAGPEYFGAGVRQGLRGDVENPTFEDFNTPQVINKTFVFAPRMYLQPLFINEVYKNPQMIQAPGF